MCAKHVATNLNPAHKTNSKEKHRLRGQQPSGPVFLITSVLIPGEIHYFQSSITALRIQAEALKL